MNHDPDIYGTDVNEFNPSRHLDSEGKIKPAIVDTKEESHGELLVFSSFEVMNLEIVALVTYGFGRRLCPGRLGLFILLHTMTIFTFLSRHIANNSLFIDIATILWTLTIEPACDDKGEHIMPNVKGNADASVLL
jgi:hypothetical protein